MRTLRETSVQFISKAWDYIFSAEKPLRMQNIYCIFCLFTEQTIAVLEVRIIAVVPGVRWKLLY